MKQCFGAPELPLKTVCLCQVVVVWRYFVIANRTNQSMPNFWVLSDPKKICFHNNNSQSSICKKSLNLKKKASQCPFRHGVNGFIAFTEKLKVVLSLWFWSLFEQTLTQQARCCYYAKWNYETRVQQEMPAHKVLH